MLCGSTSSLQRANKPNCHRSRLPRRLRSRSRQLGPACEAIWRTHLSQLGRPSLRAERPCGSDPHVRASGSTSPPCWPSCKKTWRDSAMPSSNARAELSITCPKLRGFGEGVRRCRPQTTASCNTSAKVQFQCAMKPGFCLAFRESTSARPRSPVPSSSNEVGSGVTVDICSTAGAPFDST